MVRGALIVFEGSAKSGKTTQAKLLYEKLEKSLLVEFPESNKWDDTSKMFAWLLTDKTTLIFDRYVFSNTAHDIAYNNLKKNTRLSMNRGMPKPDIVFYLKGKDSNNAIEKAYDDIMDYRWQVIDNTANVEKIHEEILARSLKVIEAAKKSVGMDLVITG